MIAYSVIFIPSSIITTLSKNISDHLAMLFLAVITFSETKRAEVKKCWALPSRNALSGGGGGEGGG